jgi:adenylosuccinate synthase
MNINRDLAITILRYLDKHNISDFPFLVMCQEYTPEDDDFVEIEPDEWEMIEEDPIYQTFQLWETGLGMNKLEEKTKQLLINSFIEKITREE